MRKERWKLFDKFSRQCTVVLYNISIKKITYALREDLLLNKLLPEFYQILTVDMVYI
jgi:hypothetical protein